MSFFNPNIQQVFEDDNREFIKLKNLIFATYNIIYCIREDYNVREFSELRAKSQLEFIRFVNRFQEQNLTLIDSNFPTLLADIAIEVMTNRVKSLSDFIVRNQPFNSLIEQHNALYESDKIQDFIELLVYSDIASKHLSKGERDFTKIFKCRKTANEIEYFTLFERLKLYEYLKNNILLEIDWNKSEINGREVSLVLRISV